MGSPKGMESPQQTELQKELPNERHNPLSDLPPPCGFGRFIGVNPAGQPQRYQSKLDERWDHFEHWIYNKWTGGIERLPSWAQTGYNKTYWGMYKVGEVASNLLGVEDSKYQYHIDTKRDDEAQREKERIQEEEPIIEANASRVEPDTEGELEEAEAVAEQVEATAEPEAEKEAAAPVRSDLPPM